MEEGEANRSGTQGSTACTYGESGPSCRHPSRRVRTHTRGGAAHTATQKHSNNKKRRSSHTMRIVSPREVQPIFTFFLLLSARLAIQCHQGAEEVVEQRHEFPAMRQLPLGELSESEVLLNAQPLAHSQSVCTFRKQMMQCFLRADCCPCGGWLILR
ncbi:surface protease GP63, putative [Trypanosoma cruzi]|nr:surface protease GP63, putative [Trypanosoma cruzi]